MSLSAVPRAGTDAPASGRRLALRVALMLAATLAVAGAFAVLALLIGGAEPPRPPTRVPFGAGLREAAPAATGIGAILLSWQSAFYRALTASLSALKSDGGVSALVGLSFAYGVFHAAGPGHGKAVISAYLVANDSAWRRGLFLSLGAGLVQGLVAFAIVAVLALALNATAVQMTAAARSIEIASFALLAAFGLWLLWRQAGRVAAALQDGQAAAAACDDGCAHGPATVPRTDASWRETLAIVVAAGARPCTGAIVVLVFALSQGLLWAGAGAVLAMSLGTALTTGALATLAVFGKRAALAMAARRPGLGATLGAGLELLAAALVAVLGLALLTGYWTAGVGA